MVTKSIAWNTGSGNITLTYQGQGGGTITVQSDANEGSARSQVITVETIGGAITRNLTVSQAACPVPVGTVLSYSYTGSYQEVTLPAGQYKLQCWGAQGGSNAAASSYSITAKDGGKGGYSEGIITLSQVTVFRVYVGGQGSSYAGGFNGGGSTTGSASYSASNEQGVSRMGGGGGATDIRLSDGALLSRMIVAGGGAGGAMCYQSKTTTVTSWESYSSGAEAEKFLGTDADTGQRYGCTSSGKVNITAGTTYRIKTVAATMTNVRRLTYYFRTSSSSYISLVEMSNNSWVTVTAPSKAATITLYIDCNFGTTASDAPSMSWTIEKQVSSQSTTTSNYSQVGGVGGGTNGGGYTSGCQGQQNAAGTGGSFGQGANQTTTGYRYCSGAGGGGWYGGGGGQKSDSSMTYCKYSGGGSGFVNIAASAGNRPSGYTGLELDSGSTYAGNTSFPNTAGTGNETGHSGNGYAKITRLA